MLGFSLKLFKKILSSGTFPQSWKISRVTPVHKRGSCSLPANYRPISVLSVLSSSFERAILPQLRRGHLWFILPEQFGFVPGAGIPDAGVLLADEIASALEDREELRIVSLDLRGAFDRIWWRLTYGISAFVAMLMTYFLIIYHPIFCCCW